MTTLKDTLEEAEFLAKPYALDFPRKNTKTLTKDVFHQRNWNQTFDHTFVNLNQLETIIYNERKKHSVIMKKL